MPQAAAPFLTFHIEHVQAQQDVADDSADNIALACPDCNRYKGPNLTTIDAQTGKVIRLSHPRMDVWDDDFEFPEAVIVGRTDIGAVTARLLQMNNEDRVRVRAELLASREM